MPLDSTSNALFMRQTPSPRQGSTVTDALVHTSTALDVAASLSCALVHVPYVSAIFGTLKQIVDVANVSRCLAYR